MSKQSVRVQVPNRGVTAEDLRREYERREWCWRVAEHMRGIREEGEARFRERMRGRM